MHPSVRGFFRKVQLKLQKFAFLDLTIGIIDNIFMSMGSFFEFYFQHQNGIIESLLILVVVITLYVGFRALFSSGGEGVGGDLGQLEETLKKLLEQKTESGADPAMLVQAQAAQEQLRVQVEQLKKELVEKEARLADSSANAGAGLDVDERKKLDGQIKELQNKLAEYEIISEDIADLSHFKEENVRLKKELETVRQGGGPAPAAAVPTPVAAAAPVAEVIASAPVAAAPAPAAEPTPAAAAAASDIIDDDIMAEFARAVEAQKKTTEEGGEAVAVASVEAAAELPQETPAAAVKVEPVIEAAAPAAPAAAAVKVEPVIEAAAPAAAVAEKSASEDSAVMGQMDIDKMLSEADTIPEESEATLNALEAALDADKLLAEASEFEGPHAEEEKLMGDFEEFVKKEGTNS
jgi:hypothetical protein